MDSMERGQSVEYAAHLDSSAPHSVGFCDGYQKAQSEFASTLTHLEEENARLRKTLESAMETYNGIVWGEDHEYVNAALHMGITIANTLSTLEKSNE